MIKIILLGNKIDLEEERNISKEEGQKFADKINAVFSETNAMNHESIEIFFNKLLQVFIEKEKKQEIKNNDKEEESKAEQKISFNLDIKKSKKRKDEDYIVKMELMKESIWNKFKKINILSSNE